MQISKNVFLINFKTSITTIKIYFFLTKLMFNLKVSYDFEWNYPTHLFVILQIPNVYAIKIFIVS